MKGDDKGEQANFAATEEERNGSNGGVEEQRPVIKHDPEFVETSSVSASQSVANEASEQAGVALSSVVQAPLAVSDSSRDSRSGNQEKTVSLEENAVEEDDEEGFTHEGQAEFERDDPLEAGYDLDEGNLIQPARIDRHFPIKTKIKTAREFFNTELLYRFDILEDDERAQLKGTYRVELKGYQGGIWTVNLGEALDVVNRKEDAEVVLSMYQRDFLHLVNGVLNPQLAMFGQKMRVNGDIRKAVRFQCLLAPQAE